MITNEEREARKHGKKIAEHVSRPYPGVAVPHAVRLDDKGIFSIKYIDAWYSAPTLKEVCTKVDEAVKAQGNPEWAYYIEIDDIDFDTEHKWLGGQQVQFHLEGTWRVVKLSTPMTVQAGAKLPGYGRRSEGRSYRLLRDVTVNDDLTLKDAVHGVEAVDAYPNGVSWIPWSSERWRVLQEIAAAAHELGRRLQETLRAEGQAVAAFLDKAGATSMLMPAVVEPLRALPAPAPAAKRRAR